MKNLANWMLLGSLAMFTAACGNDDDDNSTPTPTPSGVVELSGTLNQSMTLTADKKYLLKNFVYVPNGVTLTIEPGTVIKGDKDGKGTLVVERGGKLMANGTAEKPIVFTSNMPVGQRAAGDWGGIIILGRAKTNLPGTPIIEGGVDRPYGGSDDTDNSGVMRYVRVEYPGIAFTPGNEINGITFGGVGSGTMVEHVMVSHCGDDAFEFFGGTVNAKYLVAYKTVDDMFDTDNGYSGTIQYAVGLSDPNVADASKSNGFESDNDATGSTNAPVTAPKFVNVSLFGPRATGATTFSPDFGRGMHIRRNSKLEMHNSVVAGWPTGLLLDSEGTQNNAKVMNTIIAGSATALAAASPSSFDVSNWFTVTMQGNLVEAENATIQIPNAFSQTSPSFMPTAGSPLLSGAQPVQGTEATTFRGAFGSTDWTAGWANWNPQQMAY